MFSKQFLIFFSIGLLNVIFCDTDSMGKLFRTLLTRQTGAPVFRALQKQWIDRKTLTVIVCGETLGTDSFGYYALADYIAYEANRYNNSFTNITEFPAEDSMFIENYEFEIKMQSSMHFHDIRRIKSNQVDIRPSLIYKPNYHLQYVEISGSCMDSKNFNRSLIVDEWIPKLKIVNKTAREFMNEIIEKTPLAEDGNFFDYRSVVYHKSFNAFSEYYFGWVTEFKKHFKHRAELNSVIIFENIDRILFRTSHVFENIKNNEKTEVWHFIIEAIYDHSPVYSMPGKFEEKWAIREMHFRPDYNLFHNIGKQRDALMEEVDFLIEEIENVAENRPSNNLPKLEWYQQVLSFEKAELLPKYQNDSDLFTKVFKIPLSIKLEKCEKLPKEDGRNIKVILICQFWSDNQNRKLSRQLKMEVTGAMDYYEIEAYISYIKIIDQIRIKDSENFPYYVSGLANSKKSWIDHNYIARNITRLLIGQSSFEYLNWTNTSETFEKLIENNNFDLRICNNSYKENVAEVFKKYLQRNQRTTKPMIFDAEIFTKSFRSSIEFNVSYTSTNSMGFFMTEIYQFAAAHDVFGNWKIKSVGIEGACIWDKLIDLKLIYPIENGLMNMNISGEHEVKTFINELKKTNSKNFEGYILTNPKISQVYRNQDYQHYTNHFLEINKLRDKSDPTIIMNKESHIVFRLSMIFDHFILNSNRSTNDEWIFLIEVIQNSEEGAKDAYIKDIKVDLKHCQTLTFNHTVTEYKKFLPKFSAYSNLAAPKIPLKNWKTIPKVKLDGFEFEISYEYVKNGMAKAFVVKHFAEYNFKYGYYYDVKLEITCPKALFKPGGELIGA
ncbi:unnamed protein product [Caenorhabditis angaria]|uniref:Uncharacterized protein n=1 Tax=Caenorhabditis angaria TaxID=860376 RepID=A0A9P1MU00_9PELO|nr:unnamed protein product [Caenorhabditis angaria]